MRRAAGSSARCGAGFEVLAPDTGRAASGAGAECRRRRVRRRLRRATGWHDGRDDRTAAGSYASPGAAPGLRSRPHECRNRIWRAAPPIRTRSRRSSPARPNPHRIPYGRPAAGHDRAPGGGRAASAAPARAVPVSANPAPAANAATAAQPATPPGQQDPESIRRTALAFLQQQVAGLPGKTTTTVTTAFPRGNSPRARRSSRSCRPARACGAARRSACAARASGRGPSTCRRKSPCRPPTTSPRARSRPASRFPRPAIVARDGDLTVLPLAVITDPAQAIGATALARISAGLPLRQDLLKERGVGVGRPDGAGRRGRAVSRFRPRAARWRMRRPASRYGCGWRRARSSRRSSRTPAPWKFRYRDGSHGKNVKIVYSGHFEPRC